MFNSISPTKLLNIAKKFNNFYLSFGREKSLCKPFIINNQQVGLIRENVLAQLTLYPEVFIIHDVENADRKIETIVELNPAFRDYNERTEKVEAVLQEMRRQGLFPAALRGWRNEYYEVLTSTNNLAVMKMDRSATCLFGIRNFGVEINGYIKCPTRGICVWLQQRSATKQTWPNKWDNMVSGGLSVGFGVKETAIKEAEEEASIPKEFAEKMTSVGCVSFFFESERGIFPNTEFVYDLELPLDFIPKNADGEVQGFELLSVSECMERIVSPDFKTTSSPVLIDFFVRHGIISPENFTYYTELMELLHVPLTKLCTYKHLKTSLNGDKSQSNI